jgi:hypothetical protein
MYKGAFNHNTFIQMAGRLIAYNNECNVLCMAHPYAISQMMPSNIYSFSLMNNKELYKPMIYGIELKPCSIMQHNQIFLFPYIFKDGFPIVSGVSGKIELF